MVSALFFFWFSVRKLRNIEILSHVLMLWEGTELVATILNEAFTVRYRHEIAFFYFAKCAFLSFILKRIFPVFNTIQNCPVIVPIIPLESQKIMNLPTDLFPFAFFVVWWYWRKNSYLLISNIRQWNKKINKTRQPLLGRPFFTAISEKPISSGCRR